MNSFTTLHKDLKLRIVLGTFLTCLAGGLASPALYADFDPVNDDTDIFLANPNIASQRANVLMYVDNTANWNTAFTNEKAAMVSVVDNLSDQFNLGLMLFPETGGDNDSVDGGYLRFGVRQMDTTNKPVLSSIVNNFDVGDDKGNNATPSEGMIEVFRYFSEGNSRASHGKIKTDFANNNIYKACASCSVTQHPTTVANLGDYPLPSASAVPYTSPIVSECQKNFLIYISNGPALENSASLTPAQTELAAQGYDINNIINITPDGLEGSWMDEWAKYLANADINGAVTGEPHVVTYVVEVDPDTTGQGPAMTALMKSVAQNGEGKYFAVSSGNNGQAIVNALNQIFQDIQAVNSVFASTTLPVSVNVRGTNLNQVYIGVFRPDENKAPRWFGNLKLYILGFDDATSTLFLADATGAKAENPETGFINPTAPSFWTTASSFWSYRTSEENGSGGSSDLPDGDLVEKGGVAEMLRIDYATDQSTRNLYTCTQGTTSPDCGVGSSLSDTPFSTSNDGITAANFGLGTQSASSLTGFATQTVTGLTDTKTVTSLSTAKDPVTADELSSATLSEKSVTSLNTSVAKAVTALDNGAVVKSLDDLQRGAGANKDPVTATINGHGYSTGTIVHISGVAASEYNGSFSISVTDANNFTYFTGDTNPTNNPTITGATVTT
ncbi:MAG: hypothetical protein V3R81_05760, partial [Gammaproteobacteria bacterium]